MPRTQRLVLPDYVGGIDFNAIHYSTVAGVTGAKFPVGAKADDEYGNRRIYVKFTAQLVSPAAPICSIPIELTWTFPTITSAAPTQAEIDAGVTGVPSDVSGALAGATGQADCLFERQIIGASANQFAFTPTAALPAFAWCKTVGYARKVPTALGADLAFAKLLAGSAFVAVAAATTQAGVTLEASANGAADALVDLEG